MLRIIKTGNEDFVLMAKNEPIYISSIVKLILVMKQFRVSIDEVEHGLIELLRNDHNVAEYGIGLHDGCPKFIFSKKVAA